MSSWVHRVLRPGGATARHIRLDLYWLLGIAVLLIASGIGLRDPWPADEPRFALIARDMLATGDFLIPRVGGDLYADKPPLFFWLLAGALWLTGSLRWAFLIPSMLAALGSVVLVYDLARRLWNREIGLIAGLALLMTVQFVWQARQAQIDATLCFWTTLSLYGFMRHLVLGPNWRWYVGGWAAAGLGVITKGVGFLPLLIFLPYLFTRAAHWPHAKRVQASAGWWWWGPLAMMAVISCWIVPILAAATNDPDMAAYRDEILFAQTIERYADAWHHREPFWYFIVEVIPLLWLPWIALVPWLWASWRHSWRARDLRVVLPLVWTVLVVVFFSFSSGKRGVYLLPAVPAFVLACAPFLSELARRRGPQRTLLALAMLVGVACLIAVFTLLRAGDERDALLDSYGLDAIPPLLTIAAGCAAISLLARARHGFLAFGGCVAWILLVVSFWVIPAMNKWRSGEDFMRQVQANAADVQELGLVAYKEQYLLYLDRPVFHFGHRRRDLHQEAADASTWLVAGPGRGLLVDDRVLALCFETATVSEIGWANRQHWYVVRNAANPECVAKGRRAFVLKYSPHEQ